MKWLRLKKIYGSWTPSENFYYLSNRYVMLHAGVGSGNKIEKYPTTNSFNYSTGWDFNYRYWEMLVLEAYPKLIFIYREMSGYNYKITVDVPYS